MNLKTKVLGFVAGSALALGLASGAMAAVEGSTTVTLQNGAACTTSGISSTPFNFGTWTWNGTAYTTSSSPAGSLTIPVTNAVFGVTSCKVTVTVNDLIGQTASGTLSKNTVTLTAGAAGTVSSATGVITIPQNSSVTLSGSMDLTGVTAVAPDTYNGTIEVGTASAS